MSYIRCTSNPDSLYVWDDIDGNTYFSLGPDDPYSMPCEAFQDMMRMWDEYWGEAVCFANGNGTIYEGQTGRVVIAYNDYEADNHWEIDIWYSTFMYMFHNWQDRQWKYHARCLWCSVKAFFRDIWYKITPE